VLLKSGPLDSSEWEAMRLHTQIGAELLEEFLELVAEAEVVRSHHERFEGGGYPVGTKEDAISLLARIFSIVDTFDAITSDRPYREGRPIEVAKEAIQKESGTQFAPRLVEIFLDLPEDQLEEIRAGTPMQTKSRRRLVWMLMYQNQSTAVFLRNHSPGCPKHGLPLALVEQSPDSPSGVFRSPRLTPGGDAMKP